MGQSLLTKLSPDDTIVVYSRGHTWDAPAVLFVNQTAPAVEVTGGTIAGVAIATHYGPITTDTDAVTITLNLATTDAHTVLTTSGVGSSRTVNFSNVTVGQKFHVEIVQAASGGPYTVTWDAGVRWASGVAPTLATGANKADLMVFYCRASGSYAGTMAIPNY